MLKIIHDPINILQPTDVAEVKLSRFELFCVIVLLLSDRFPVIVQLERLL